jgi:ribosomal protein L31
VPCLYKKLKQKPPTQHKNCFLFFVLWDLPYLNNSGMPLKYDGTNFDGTNFRYTLHRTGKRYHQDIQHQSPVSHWIYYDPDNPECSESFLMWIGPARPEHTVVIFECSRSSQEQDKWDKTIWRWAAALGYFLDEQVSRISISLSVSSTLLGLVQEGIHPNYLKAKAVHFSSKHSAIWAFGLYKPCHLEVSFTSHAFWASLSQATSLA